MRSHPVTYSSFLPRISRVSPPASACKQLAERDALASLPRLPVSAFFLFHFCFMTAFPPDV